MWGRRKCGMSHPTFPRRWALSTNFWSRLASYLARSSARTSGEMISGSFSSRVEDHLMIPPGVCLSREWQRSLQDDSCRCRKGPTTKGRRINPSLRRTLTMLRLVCPILKVVEREASDGGNGLNKTFAVAVHPIWATAHEAGRVLTRNLHCLFKLLRGIEGPNMTMNFGKEAIIIACFSQFVPNYAWRPQ